MSKSVRLPGIPKEITSVEMRVEVRYPILQRCFVYPRGTTEPEAWRCIAYNISAGGLGVTLPARFEKGTVLNVQAWGLTNACPLQVRVRHMKQVDEVWFAGCELLKRMADAELRAWRSGPMDWLDEFPNS